MGFQESSAFCSACNRQVLVRRPGTIHFLHLLISVFTAGLWIPAWILVSIKVGGWRCSVCGTPAGARGSSGLLIPVGLILALLAIGLVAYFVTSRTGPIR